MAVRRQAELIEAARQIPIFTQLTQRQLREVARACSVQYYEPGETIVKELDWGQHLVAILEGSARVVHNDRPIGTLKRGDVVGELSLIDGNRRSATVYADTAVEGLVLYATAFRKLLDANPSMCRNLLLALAAKLRDADRHVAMQG